MADPGPFVSVVTPFYNGADYLSQCIDSVLSQTHTDFEYVLLDNCSTDGSDEIARDYARRDTRIRLVRNENFLSQVENYNRALSLISPRSQYCKLVEADNWIYPECLMQMVSLAQTHPRVGIVSAYCITEHALRFLGLPQATQVLTGLEAARRHLLDDAYLFGAPTTVLMRSDIVRSRSPFYDASTWLVEDLSACYEVLQDWDFGFVHQILTFVRTLNEGSIQSARPRGHDVWILDRLAVLIKHGRQFLTEGEFEGALRKTRHRYYALLAEGVLRGESPGFWEYHSNGLATFGYRIDRPRLVWHVLLQFVRRAANPGRSAMAFYRRMRGAK